MNKIITFVTYESPWFLAGGIAAVMGQLPSATEAASHLPTVVITPFHKNSTKIGALQMLEVGAFELPYDGGPIPVTVFHHLAGCPWYFIRPDHLPALQAPFFGGMRHPYDVSKKHYFATPYSLGLRWCRHCPQLRATRSPSLNQSSGT